MKNKKIVIIAAAVILLIVLIFIVIIKSNKKENITVDDIIKNLPSQESDVVVQSLEDGTKVNTSTKLKETKQLEGLEIKESQLTNKDGITTLLATVENNTQEEKGKQKIKIVLLDSTNRELAEIEGIIQKLKPRAKTQLNVEITGNYTDIYDYRIEKR